MEKTKGYIASYCRNYCEGCKYFLYDGELPKQERVSLCTKLENPFETDFESICDEFEEQ